MMASCEMADTTNTQVGGGGDQAVDASDNKILGGGAINEKPRHYNPLPDRNEKEKSNENNKIKRDDDSINNDAKRSWDPANNLSHMLHALVGLDRYPNYLSRFQHTSDMDLLEQALEQRLQDVRRQKTSIIERRMGIQKLVRKYTSSVQIKNDGHEMVISENECNDGQGDCLTCWLDHPLLSPPKTWNELRERNILTESAFNAAFRSVKRQKRSKTNQDTEIMHVICGKVRVNLDPSLLENWMSQEMFDVYSFPLLTKEVKSFYILYFMFETIVSQ